VVGGEEWKRGRREREDNRRKTEEGEKGRGKWEENNRRTEEGEEQRMEEGKGKRGRGREE
jgi:hypothetical protein